MKFECILLGSGGHAKALLALALSNQMGLKVSGVVSNSSKELELAPGARHFDDLSSAVAELETKIYLNGIGLSLGLPMRRQISEEAKSFGLEELGVVSRFAYINEHVSLMPSAQVFNSVSINYGAKIGESVILNTGSLVEHGTSVGHNCFIGPGAIILGDVHLGSDVSVGAGAILNPGVSIADGVIIGAGTVVVRDIETAGTYVGVPAKRVDDYE